MAGVHWQDGVVQDAVSAVRLWLGTNPGEAALLANLPALELALGAYVKNQDDALLALTCAALERLNTKATLTSLSNATLAAVMSVNLNAFQLTRDGRFADAVGEASQVAVMRYDEEGYFRADAANAPPVLETDANARLAEILYRVWIALDDQTLRPLAGEVLSKVSAMFDSRAGLYGRMDFADQARTEPAPLDVYAAVMQMFITAAETTKRGTYFSRAAIVANYVLGHPDIGTTGMLAEVAFASALQRLGVCVQNKPYESKATEILNETRALLELDGPTTQAVTLDNHKLAIAYALAGLTNDA